MKKIFQTIFVAILFILATPFAASAAIGDMVTYPGTGAGPASIIFDGTYIWTVNSNNATRVTQTGAMTNFSLGSWFSSYGGSGIAFDGVNILASGRTVGPGVGYGGIVKLSTVTGGVTFYGYPNTVNIYPGGSAFDGANPTKPWIITNPNGNLWTTQWNWMTIHKTTPSGAFGFYTIPTTSPACTGGFFGCIFSSPRAIAFDGVNMWTANSMAGTVTKVNPSGGAVMYSTAGTTPSAIAFDGTNMWTANGASPLSLSFGGSNSVTKITPTGGVITYAGTGSRPVAIAFDGTNMWTANMNDNSVTRVSPTGAMTTFYGTGASPIAIAFDGTNMWTANKSGNSVTKIGAIISSGTVSVSSNISSSWTITGPATIPGSGTAQSLPSQPTGMYSIVWGAVFGYNKPLGSSLTLTSGGTITFTGTYTPTNAAPLAPTITGPLATNINTSQTYTFTSTDPNGDQIRYGVDWNMDGTADEWLPAGVTYVNSGVSQSTTHSWTTSGPKTFQVLAQDAPGANSAWTNYTVTVNAVVNGSCGSSDGGTFSVAPSTNLCSAGTATLVSGTGPWIWACNGSGGGSNATCGALTNVIPGSCGSANGTPTTVKPTTNLCSVGAASAVAGSGPWNWTCAGVNGGADASCNAPKISCGDSLCQPPETVLTCPSDCKTKYQQF